MRSIIDEEEKEGTDTEITLGMKSLLGVFFGAVLVCGIFFGFGYSLGRGSAHPAAAAAASPAIAVSPSADAGSTSPAGADSASSQPASTGDSNLKTIVSDQTQPNAPSRPSTASATQYEYVATPQGPARRPIGAPDKPLARPTQNSSPAPALAAVTPSPAPAYAKPSAAVVRESQPPAAAPAVAPRAETAALTETRTESPAASNSAGSAMTGSTMVQIAAVTHQEDATILVSALKRHGYTVVVRNEPNDSLLHVQVGPFATRDQAKAMRARLLADGYNAILK
jgi:hypothetical protein